jgi:putative nucleotidyltransferase with HDIG domain
VIAVGATLLALAASFWLARMITEPVGRLSAALIQMAASRDVAARLALTGSSRELDALTDTFNALMASVAAAEDQTQAAYTGAIRALATALDARDPYTAGHSERVSVLSVAIGRSLRLRDEEIEVIRLGALLHDIGKIGVPDAVLLKPSALTPAEFDIIKQHPGAGARILESVPFLIHHIPIVELHHERPDGRGYPHGLRGDEIPIAAHIVHVADAYDAITSARAYRGARPSGDALLELWRFAGTGFHAEAVGALATVLPGVVSETGEVVVEHAHA